MARKRKIKKGTTIKALIFAGLMSFVFIFILSYAFGILSAELEKKNVKPAISINLPEGGEGQDYWLWIEVGDRYSFDQDKTANRTKRGDIISIEPAIPQYEPTAREKAAWAVIKVRGLTKEDIQKYTQPWQENPEIQNSKILAYRQYRLDLDALGLKVGLDPNPKNASVFRRFAYLKNQSDLARYEKGRKLYAFKNYPKYLALKLKNFIIPPSVAVTENISCVNGKSDPACGGVEHYINLTTWEVGTERNLVAAQVIETAYGHDDDGPLDDNNITISGAIVNSTYYRKITAPVGERHNGIVDNSASPVGFTLHPTTATNNNTGLVDLRENFAVVEWLRIRNLTTGFDLTGYAIILSATNYREMIARNNIIHDPNYTAYCRPRGIAIYSEQSSSTLAATVYNNIIVDFYNSKRPGYGIEFMSGKIFAANNTLLGNDRGMHFAGYYYDASVTLKNNVVVDSVTANYSLAAGKNWNSNSSNNACDTASVACTDWQSAGELPNLDGDDLFTDLTASAQNLHLASTTASSILVNSGTDASAGIGCTVGTNCYDIDNNDRPFPVGGSWDIGADEDSAALPPETCVDGIQNQGETDFDCGGPNCPDCENGDSCLDHSDCSSGYCDPISNTCQPAPTCNDGIQNQDETDFDCGGDICGQCANGQTCWDNSDCSSGYCDPVPDTCQNPPPPPNLSDWSYHLKLTFKNSEQAEDLVDFQFLVHLTKGNFNFNQAQDDGKDILFIDADGATFLAYEIEMWDKARKEAYIWVKVPQIDGGSDSDYIWLYWGNDDPGLAGQDPPATWSNGYQSVLHFNEGSGNYAYDSTGRLNRAFITDDEADGWLTDGKLGVAYEFDGNDDFATITDSDDLDFSDQITIEGWLDPRGFQKTEGEVTGLKDSSSEYGNSTIRKYPNIIRITDDLYVIADLGNNSNINLISAIIDDQGMINEVGSFTISNGIKPAMIKITDNVFAVAYIYYQGGAKGRLQTFTIDSQGNFGSVALDTLNWGNASASFNIIHTSGDIYAITYSSTYNYLMTVDINSSGNIGSVQGNFSFGWGAGIFPVHISDNVYAAVYDNSGANWLQTFTLSADGQTKSDIESFNWGSGISNFKIKKVSNDVYVISDLSSQRFYLRTIRIGENGDIGSGILDWWILDEILTADWSSTNYGLINIANNIYGAVYQGRNYDGWLKTFIINPDGTFPSDPLVSVFEFGLEGGANPAIIPAKNNLYVVAYQNRDYSGVFKTVGINTGRGLTKNNTYVFDANKNNQAIGLINKEAITSALANGWNYAVLTYDQGAPTGQIKFYVNGVERDLADYGWPINNNDDELRFAHLFYGAVDELRLANVARSADWIKAQYLSMTGVFSPELFLGYFGQSLSGDKWAWAETFGWFSLDCKTVECQDAGKEYEVIVPDLSASEPPAEGDVEGWAWSEYAGWVCFGKTCQAVYGAHSNAWATYYKEQYSSDIDGWANVVVLGEAGWLKLRESNNREINPAGYVFKPCYDCDTAGAGIFCRICYTDEDWGGSGKACSACHNCEGDGGTCGNCDYCDDYGLAYRRDVGNISGWAWNGNWPYNGSWQDNGGQPGIGWLSFNYSGQTNVPPWLETRWGDVYAGNFIEGLAGSPPAGQYNATYLIHVDYGGGQNVIRNFETWCEEKYQDESKFPGYKEKCKDSAYFGDWGQLFPDIPKKSNDYWGTLGKIDIAGILRGDYGEVVDCHAQPDCLTASSPIVLGGKVYYFDGDQTINSPIVVASGNQLQKGNGLVVIKGDLDINANIGYQDTTITNLRQLASLGWLVIKDDNGLAGGRVEISPEVANLIGVVYAEDRIDTCEANGSLTPCDQNYLNANGPMVSNRFILDRLYVNKQSNRSAERIVDDGRALVNPPPGLTDLTKGLPIWSAVAP
ncbi:MAG: DUF2341 domain-containing protein [bacterium]